MKNVGDKKRSAWRKAPVAAIVVTFNPQIEDLRSTLKSVSSQTNHVIAIDNASANAMAIRSACAEAGAELVGLSENFGIARAQNEGLKRARAFGAKYVLLLDQDSCPAPGMIDALVRGSSREGG